LGDRDVRRLGLGHDQLADDLALLIGSQMPPADVRRDHVRLGAVVRRGDDLKAGSPRRETDLAAGAVSVATVEDHPLVENDRLALAVGLDVGDEFYELRTLHQRKHVRQRMEREFLIPDGEVSILGNDLACRWITFPKALDGRHRRGLHVFMGHAAPRASRWVSQSVSAWSLMRWCEPAPQVRGPKPWRC